MLIFINLRITLLNQPLVTAAGENKYSSRTILSLSDNLFHDSQVLPSLGMKECITKFISGLPVQH